MAAEYKLSGSFGGLPVLGPLLAIPACFVLSLIYSYIDVYNPFVYLTAVAWFGHMFALSVGLQLICTVSRCRSPVAMMLLGLLAGVLTVYFNWACFVDVFIGMLDDVVGPSLVEVVTDPEFVLLIAGGIQETGWYEIFGGMTPSGNFLLVIWIIEGGGLLLAGVLGGFLATHEEVFCEDCGVWAEKLNLDIRLSIPEEPTLLDRALEGDVDALLDLPAADLQESVFLGLNLQACPKCTNTATLDFDMVEMKYDDDGKLERDATDLSKVFVLTAAQLEAFEQLGQELLPTEQSTDLETETEAS